MSAPTCLWADDYTTSIPPQYFTQHNQPSNHQVQTKQKPVDQFNNRFLSHSFGENWEGKASPVPSHVHLPVRNLWSRKQSQILGTISDKDQGDKKFDLVHQVIFPRKRGRLG